MLGGATGLTTLRETQEIIACVDVVIGGVFDERGGQTRASRRLEVSGAGPAAELDGNDAGTAQQQCSRSPVAGWCDHDVGVVVVQEGDGTRSEPREVGRNDQDRSGSMAFGDLQSTVQSAAGGRLDDERGADGSRRRRTAHPVRDGQDLRDPAGPEGHHDVGVHREREFVAERSVQPAAQTGLPVLRAAEGDDREHAFSPAVVGAVGSHS